MTGDRFRVRLIAEAKDMLRRIGKTYGKNTYEVIRDKILDLESDPGKKGEPLGGPLQGLYSLHYSRFRIIYRIHEDEVEVIVVGAGYHASRSRDDIYQVIRRLVESGQLAIRDRDKKK